MSVYAYDTVREPVLTEAARVVHGDRARTYDNEREDESYPVIRKTARLWSNYLHEMLYARATRTGEISEFTPADVARMMALHKKARYEVNPGHRDSRVDELGYLGIAHDLELEEDS